MRCVIETPHEIIPCAFILEIGDICTRVAEVHNCQKQQLLQDILACCARKLDTGTYHRASDNSPGFWEMGRVCRWLSSLYTFARNSFFDDNGISVEELLSQLRSMARDDHVVAEVPHPDVEMMMVNQAQIGQIFQLWNERHLRELSQGMPHYVDVDSTVCARSNVY